MTALQNVTLFLTNLFFSLCIFVLILRLVLQFFRANASNPVCQLVAKVTNPVILPLRKLLPRVEFIDIATLLVLFITEVIKYVILGLLSMGSIFNFFAIIIFSLVHIITTTTDLFFYAIIIQVILSWVAPNQVNPLTQLLYIITEPLLSRARRIIPPLAGFDFSPIVVIIVLKVINIIIQSYIPV